MYAEPRSSRQFTHAQVEWVICTCIKQHPPASDPGGPSRMPWGYQSSRSDSRFYVQAITISCLGMWSRSREQEIGNHPFWVLIKSRWFLIGARGEASLQLSIAVIVQYDARVLFPFPFPVWLVQMSSACVVMQVI